MLAELTILYINVDVKWLTELPEDWLLSFAYFSTKQNEVPRTHKTINGIVKMRLTQVFPFIIYHC